MPTPRSLSLLWFAGALAAVLFGNSLYAGTTFHQLRFLPSGNDEYKAVAGKTGYMLAHPDVPDHPRAWDSPLTIRNSKGTCTTRPLLVQQIYAAANAPFTIVVSYSGSKTYVDFIDNRKCEDSAPRIQTGSSAIRLQSNKLTIVADCVCESAERPCSCDSAQVIELLPKPQVLAAESMALTKAQIGVAFSGNAKVLEPKTPRARLVE